MKKSFIYILIFLNLSFLFADSYITINNQSISLDTSIKEIQGLFGIQKELDIILFEFQIGIHSAINMQTLRFIPAGLQNCHLKLKYFQKIKV